MKTNMPKHPQWKVLYLYTQKIQHLLNIKFSQYSLYLEEYIMDLVIWNNLHSPQDSFVFHSTTFRSSDLKVLKLQTKKIRKKYVLSVPKMKVTQWIIAEISYNVSNHMRQGRDRVEP